MNAHSVLEKTESFEHLPTKPIRPVRLKLFVVPAKEKALFEDSLLEATSGQRHRRTWATLLSFVLQCLLLSVLVLIPLWYTEVLPQEQLLTFLVTPSPPPPPPPPATAASSITKVVKVASDVVNGQLRMPGRIPSRVQLIKEAESPAPLMGTGGVVGGVPGGIPGGQLGE